MESLLKVPVQRAIAQALPFRVLFEEHRRRREAELLAHIDIIVYGPRPQRWTPEAWLRAAIIVQEDAYASLAEATQQLADGIDRAPLDRLIIDCQRTDDPLKQLLHCMNSTAVCLSGGGIRSASFSLGVLQGLARFSRGSGPSLLSSLDFLSTVSGGGYMGSWMMSWIYRRMQTHGTGLLLRAMVISIDSALALMNISANPDPEDLLKPIAVMALDFASWQSKAPHAHPPLEQRLRDSSDALKPQVEAVVRLGKRYDSAEDSRPVDHSVAATLTDLRSALLLLESNLQRTLGWIAEDAYAAVLSGLAGDMDRTGGDPEPQTVRHLRSFTSYLAPELGLTIDTFTLAAIVLRNFIVNWIMLLPVLIALIAFILGIGAFTLYVGQSTQSNVAGNSIVRPDRLVDFLIFAAAAFCCFFTLPSKADHSAGPGRRRTSLSKRQIGTWVFLGSVVVGSWMITSTTPETTYGDLVLLPHWLVGSLSWLLDSRLVVTIFKPDTLGRFAHWLHAELVPQTTVAEAIVSLVGFTLLGLFTYSIYTGDGRADLMNRSRRRLSVKLWIASSSTVMIVVTIVLLWVDHHILLPALMKASHVVTVGAKIGDPVHGVYWQTPVDHPLYLIFGFPLVLGTLCIAVTLFCAFVGTFEGEDDREWWVRGGGVLLASAVSWIVAQSLVLYGTPSIWSIPTLVSGSIAGLFASYLGFSGLTPATGAPLKTDQMQPIGKFLARHKLILPVVGGAAILLIAAGMVFVEEKIRLSFEQFIFGARDSDSAIHVLASAAIVFLVFAIVALAANYAININFFSLHGMYRMRLMRAFLGASNVFRHPDLFTQFDKRDTPHEAQMPCYPNAPMHLLNATLNLTGTRNPAWRQRRAEGFSFSPVVCGGWRVGFVPTSMYAGSRGLGNKDNGLTLATAMAISGAAANPNMGYQSSPVLSLLMTFFNLRLGCWLPNPARPKPRFGPSATNEAFFRQAGPRFALFPLFAEALEMTDDQSRWIELTDGGHFENLALYEMILRRCRFIILVDAGADRSFSFEDLGNAIRKIQIDLGVPIEFPPELHMEAGPQPCNHYCAVANIRYSCVDPPFVQMESDLERRDEHREDADPRDGWLIYIKAAMTGTEPVDILQYQRTHASFPHESTGDQFFTESQFESYRHLGSFILESIVGTDTSAHGDRQMPAFLRRAIEHGKYGC